MHVPTSAGNPAEDGLRCALILLQERACDMAKEVWGQFTASGLVQRGLVSVKEINFVHSQQHFLPGEIHWGVKKE